MTKFADNNIGVYCSIQADDSDAEYYGMSLLVAQYFARLYAIVRVDRNARDNLIAVLDNPSLLYAMLTRASDDYSSQSSKRPVEIQFGLAETKDSKKECSFFTSYNVNGMFSPKFQSKGFGILGKNVESAAITACFATAVFFIENSGDQDKADYIVMRTIKILGSKLLGINKLSLRDEVDLVRQTVAEVSA